MTEQDKDLKNLLEKYMEKSEELEKRESKILKHVELVQTAVASLQAWNKQRKPSTESVRVNLKEIEEETQRIKEETERIQKEVEKKKEENKKLEREIRGWKKTETRKIPAGKSESFREFVEDERRRRKDVETREEPENHNLRIVQEKLRKLQAMEKKLKEESEQESEELRRNKENLREKIEILEMESEFDMKLVQALKKKLEKR